MAVQLNFGAKGQIHQNGTIVCYFLISEVEESADVLVLFSYQQSRLTE